MTKRKPHDIERAIILKSPYRLPITKRKCMKCQEEFDSLGPMNRICGECNSLNSRSAKRVERGGTRGTIATHKGDTVQ